MAFTLLLILIVVFRRNSSPCFTCVDPAGVSPDSTVPKPTQTKDASDGLIVSDREESADVRVRPKGRGRNTRSCWMSTEEAINVFMRRSPLASNRSGRESLPSKPIWNGIRTQESFAERSDNEKVIPSVSNVSTVNKAFTMGEPDLILTTLSGSDADGTPPLGVGTDKRDLDSAQGGVLLDGPPATEDMPSFNEWAKKRLEEQGHPSDQQIGKRRTVVAKKNRLKNYASVDCGAKVLTANAESQSASAVLSHDQDDYMLNPCTARAWLVLELCEAVQLERLELANFELFSSSPHHFNVYSSDRYPTRDWNFIGTFEAIDEKTAQSFSLHQTSFSKYIKVELVSHYGAEHFCPLSLIRVYGTSEYEALDTEEQTPDDQSSSASIGSGNSVDDSILSSTTLESTNLFGSAKEAVLTIVKKAAAALSPRNTSEIVVGQEEHDGLPDDLFGGNCRCLLGSPNLGCQMEKFSGALTACNQSLAERSLAVLACDYDKYKSMLHRLRPRKEHLVLACSNACSAYIDSRKMKSRRSASLCSFYEAALGPLRFGALCHLDKLNLDLKSGSSGAPPITLSTKTSRTSAQITEPSETLVMSEESVDASFRGSDYVTSPDYTSNVEEGQSSTSMEMKITDGIIVTAKNSIIFTAKIESNIADSYLLIHPTPSTEQEGNKETVANSVDSSASPSQEDNTSDTDESPLVEAFADLSKVQSEDRSSNLIASVSSLAEGPEISGSILGEPIFQSSHVEAREVTSIVVVGGGETVGNGRNSGPLTSPDVSCNDGPEMLALPVPFSSSHPELHVTSNGSDAKQTVLPGGIVGSILSSGQKESVFVRLSNRIKALELNMSLSGQYLEELSRRYRKQMEEMQRAFNKTISALNETARMALERDMKQQEIIGVLQIQLDTLSKVVANMAEQQEGLHSQVIARHLFLMMVEIVVMMAMFLACFRQGFQQSGFQSYSSAVVSRVSSGRTKAIDQKESATPIRALAGRPPERRSSDPNLAGLSPYVLLGDRRRPSSEALNVSGTYSDLLIVEPTIPIWVDRPLISKEFDQSKKSRRKKNRNKGGQGRDGDGLYRSMSNDALVSKPPAHPRAARKISATDVSSAGLLFDGPCPSRIVDIPVDKNYDDIFEESVSTSTTTKGDPVDPLHRPPPPPPSQSQRQSVVVSKPWDVQKGSCALSHSLSFNKSFNLKKASLAATSLVYGNGYGGSGGKEGSGGLDDLTAADDAHKEGYRFKKVSQKIY